MLTIHYDNSVNRTYGSVLTVHKRFLGDVSAALCSLVLTATICPDF